MSNWFRVYGFADVLDSLLVGAYPLDQEDVGMLEWMKIERVLNLVRDEEYEPGERAVVESALIAAGIEERRLGFEDYGRLPSPELERAVTEIVDWLQDGRRVYLHCRAGWQRSAAVAAGVVAVREEVGVEEALDVVRMRKPSADPLPQQREDLLRWWAERGGEPRDGRARSGSGSDAGSGDEPAARDEGEGRGERPAGDEALARHEPSAREEPAAREVTRGSGNGRSAPQAEPSDPPFDRLTPHGEIRARSLKRRLLRRR